MLIAPLLSFLTYAVHHGHDAVVAQSAYHGFRDTTASGHLSHARTTCDGIDDVCRRGVEQVALCNDGHRGGRVFQQLSAGDACHHHLVDHGIALFHHEVELSGAAQVHLLDDGLMPHITHLQCHGLLGQRLKLVMPVDVGDGGLVQFGNIEGYAYQWLVVHGISHLAAE